MPRKRLGSVSEASSPTTPPLPAPARQPVLAGAAEAEVAAAPPEAAAAAAACCKADASARPIPSLQEGARRDGSGTAAREGREAPPLSMARPPVRSRSEPRANAASEPGGGDCIRQVRRWSTHGRFRAPGQASSARSRRDSASASSVRPACTSRRRASSALCDADGSALGIEEPRMRKAYRSRRKARSSPGGSSGTSASIRARTRAVTAVGSGILVSSVRLWSPSRTLAAAVGGLCSTSRRAGGTPSRRWRRLPTASSSSARRRNDHEKNFCWAQSPGSSYNFIKKTIFFLLFR